MLSVAVAQSFSDDSAIHYNGFMDDVMVFHNGAYTTELAAMPTLFFETDSGNSLSVFAREHHVVWLF